MSRACEFFEEGAGGHPVPAEPAPASNGPERNEYRGEIGRGGAVSRSIDKATAVLLLDWVARAAANVDDAHAVLVQADFEHGDARAKLAAGGRMLHEAAAILEDMADAGPNG